MGDTTYTADDIPLGNLILVPASRPRAPVRDAEPDDAALAAARKSVEDEVERLSLSSPSRAARPPKDCLLSAGAADTLCTLVKGLTVIYTRMTTLKQEDLDHLLAADKGSFDKLYALSLIDRIILKLHVSGRCPGSTDRAVLNLQTIPRADVLRYLSPRRCEPSPYVSKYSDDLTKAKTGSLAGDLIALVGATGAVRDPRVVATLVASTRKVQTAQQRASASCDIVLGLVELLAHVAARNSPDLQKQVCVCGNTASRFETEYLRNVALRQGFAKGPSGGRATRKELCSYLAEAASRTRPALPYYDSTETARYLLHYMGRA